VGRET
jgi:hypothetical protein